MNAFCSICGHRWDTRDPGVRYIYGDGSWECADEGLCFDRRAMAEIALSPEFSATGEREA